MTDRFAWRDQFHWHKAFGKSDVPSHIRPIGYIIWDYTNERGEQAFPGNEIIAQSTGLNKKTVERGLTFLREAGWLFRVSKGSNSGRKAMNSVYRLSYPAGYSEQETHATSVPLGEDGTGDTHDPNQGTPVSRTGDTHDPLNRSLSNQVTDPPPLTSEDEDDDISSLYDDEINVDAEDAETLRFVRLTELLEKGFARSARTDAENQELLAAGFTYVDGPRFSINGGPTGGWKDPSPEAFARRRSLVDAHHAQRLAVRRRQWEEMQRVEAEARAERGRQFEAKRAQRQAQAEVDNLAELKSIEWVSRNWDRFEKFCATEGVNLDRQLSLAQRAQEKATSSPFGLFKSMVANGVDPGSSSSSWDSVCASPASGHAWQE